MAPKECSDFKKMQRYGRADHQKVPETPGLLATFDAQGGPWTVLACQNMRQAIEREGQIHAAGFDTFTYHECEFAEAVRLDTWAKDNCGFLGHTPQLPIEGSISVS